MQQRICPQCFTRWYSSDARTIWKCETCGYDIPVPKDVKNKTVNKRRNINE